MRKQVCNGWNTLPKFKRKIGTENTMKSRCNHKTQENSEIRIEKYWLGKRASHYRCPISILLHTHNFIQFFHALQSLYSSIHFLYSLNSNLSKSSPTFYSYSSWFSYLFGKCALLHTYNMSILTYLSSQIIFLVF